MVVILDYGLGNLGSIVNMLRRVDLEAKISKEEKDILDTSSIILPGVGHFDHGMTHLQASGLIPVLNEVVVKGRKPLLGICLGAQLLLENSEEGTQKGLGWIPGSVKKFADPKDAAGNVLPVPHMAWSGINTTHPVFGGMDADRRFYFVHSYYMQPAQRENILCTTGYGGDFASGVVRDNIMGVQFHPEKSHKYGMKFFENYFAKLRA